MKEVPLSDVKDDLSRYLRQAAKEEIVITRHGKAAGLLIGFESEDDWFDYRLENDPRFLSRIAAARANLRAGRGARLEEVGTDDTASQGTGPARGQKRPRSRPTTQRRSRGR
jgi:prevent-host-death family protein